MGQWRSTRYTTFEPESPRASLSADGRNRLVARYDIEWDSESIGQAVDDFVGYPLVKTGKNGATLVKYITRVTPHPYAYRFTATPEYSNVPALFCTGLDPVAQGTSTPDAFRGNEFGRAAIASCNATYESLTYDIATDTEVRESDGFPHDANDTIFRYITRQWKPAGKVLSLGYGFMRVRDDAVAANRLPIKGGIPLNVPAAELAYTWHQVPEDGIPSGTIQSTLGAINSVAFDDYTAETLLLLSADLRRYRHPVGVRLVDITYRMKWLPNINPADGLAKGHNFVPRVIAGAVVMKEITSDGTNAGNRPYRKLPFKPLFRPTQP